MPSHARCQVHEVFENIHEIKGLGLRKSYGWPALVQWVLLQHCDVLDTVAPCVGWVVVVAHEPVRKMWLGQHTWAWLHKAATDRRAEAAPSSSSLPCCPIASRIPPCAASRAGGPAAGRRKGRRSRSGRCEAAVAPWSGDQQGRCARRHPQMLGSCLRPSMHSRLRRPRNRRRRHRHIRHSSFTPTAAG